MDDSTKPPRRRRHAPASDAPKPPLASDEPSGPPSWRERNAATVMGAVLGGLLIMIMLVQAC